MLECLACRSEGFRVTTSFPTSSPFPPFSKCSNSLKIRFCQPIPDHFLSLASDLGALFRGLGPVLQFRERPRCFKNTQPWRRYQWTRPDQSSPALGGATEGHLGSKGGREEKFWEISRVEPCRKSLPLPWLCQGASHRFREKRKNQSSWTVKWGIQGLFKLGEKLFGSMRLGD